MKRLLITLLVAILVWPFNRCFGQRYFANVHYAVDSIPDIQYGTAPDAKHQTTALLLDLYQPSNDAEVKRPLLVFAHGGGFTSGTRKWPSVKIMSEKLAALGYVVASIDYRLDPDFNLLKSDSNRRAMTDAMFDMKAAIQFFRQNAERFKIDVSKIFISGESAGAITAMMAGYIDKDEELQAYPRATPSTTTDSKVNGVMCLCGAMTDTRAIDRTDNPPLLWVHGSSDPLIPVSWAYPILDRAEAIGLPHEKVLYEGATHCPWYFGLPDWQTYMDRVVKQMARFMYAVVTNQKLSNISVTRAPLQVADIIQNHMVVQQGQPFRIWGKTTAGDTVVVQVGWQQEPTSAVAGKDGEWMLSVDVPKISPGDFTEHQISVTNGYDSIGYANIMIGEVWICAGQSNMDFNMQEIKGWYGGVPNAETEMAAAGFPAIRMYTEHVAFSIQPQSISKGIWRECSPATVGGFSAVSYYFGRELFQRLNVPVGLVVTAAAGASSQAFTPLETLQQNSFLKQHYWEPSTSFISSQAKVDSLDFFTKVTKPTLLYNGMIHPLRHLSIRGFTWYQGESNYNEGARYTQLCSAMIRSWRQQFAQGDLPFYYVQIAPFTKNADSCVYTLGLFWEAQQALSNVANTGMALSMDVGDTIDVHPRNKKPVGERLAKLALHQTYGRTDIAASGPVLKQYKISKNAVAVLSFKIAGSQFALATRDGKAPRFFQLAGEDKVFHPAKAIIKGNKVLLSSGAVPKPVAIRYAFTNDAVTNLQSKDGLPVAPFRTDNWPACTEATQ